MKPLKVAITKLTGNEDIPAPMYMSEKSAGMDICAAIDGQISIKPGEWMLIPTGLAIALPDGFEAQIRPRSGLALKYGISLLNSPGTIDADYRGEIKIILVNHGKEPFIVKRGERIAQMVVSATCRILWEETAELDDTKRGEGGFGHTQR